MTVDTIGIEGQTLTLNGAQTVRYGYGGNWVQRSVSSGAVCSGNTFGGDPAPGSFKQCDLQGSGPPATTTAVVTAANPSAVGAPVTLTATVTGSAPTGNVSFLIYDTALKSVAAPLSGTGNTRTATYVATFSAVGSAYIAASYNGDVGNAVSLSATASQRVAAPTTTTIGSSVNPSAAGAATTLTATVAGINPSGTVTFKDGATTLGTGVLSGSGNSRSATYAASFTVAGSHILSAAYGGDANNPPSTSAALSQTVSAAAGQWTKIADEGQSFTVSGTQTVRFGAGSSWVQKSVTGSGTCSSDYFGNDPIYGTVKQCDVLSVVAPSTSLLANSSFEAPALGAGNYSYNASGATWIFGGEAGVTGNGSAFTNESAGAPDGTQTGFIQRMGTATQTLTLAAGSYSLSFQAVQRGGSWQSGAQVLRILVDGTTIGTFQPPAGSYATSPAYTFSAMAGSHTVQFTGVGSGSDYTAFVDSVALVRTGNAVVLPSPPVSAAPVVNYEYDAQGNPTRTIQAPGVSGFGFATQASYDALNRAKDTTDARSGKTSFGYDALDRTTSITDPRRLVTQSPRNGLGDTTQLVSPDTGTATMSYDAAGNLKTRLDSRGVLQTYVYDPLNRPTNLAYTQSGQAQLAFGWAYDEAAASNGVGRLTSSSFPAGTGSYAYDPLGRLLTQVQTVAAASGANASAVQSTVRYAYDAAGHVTTLTYPSGRVLAITYAGGKASALALAASSNATAAPLLTQIQFSPFGGPISWQQQMASGAQAMSRTYDLSGRLVRLQLGGFVRDIAYDAADRIAGYTHYDATTGTASTAATALNQSFGYDELGRITSISTPTASWTIGYDANGNRTGVTLNATTSAYTTEATSNRLSSITNPARSFGYDNAGNTVADSGSYSATYDLAGRMASITKVGVTTSYAYNGNGQRVRKFDTSGSASTTLFVYDQDGQLLGEYNQTGTALREYVWLGSTPVAMFTPDPANANNPPKVFYLHADHLDTPRVALDQNNNVRWQWMAEPFGTSAPQTNPANLGAFTQPLRFPGQYADQESGLLYNWMRSYDTTIGRYTQSDPIGLGGGINTYTYAYSNPLIYVDPNGLWPGQQSTPGGKNQMCVAACTAGGAVVGGVTGSVAGGAVGGIGGAAGGTLVAPGVGTVGGGVAGGSAGASWGGAVGAGIGGALGNAVGQVVCPSNDEECDKKRQQDGALCVAIAGARYGRAGIAICMKSAEQRYAECLRFEVGGIKTPLHGVDTPL